MTRKILLLLVLITGISAVGFSQQRKTPGNQKTKTQKSEKKKQQVVVSTDSSKASSHLFGRDSIIHNMRELPGFNPKSSRNQVDLMIP